MNTTAIHDSDWDYERLAWRISLTPVHVIAIITSIYRIARRYKTRQSGLDDYAATLTLILDLIFFPTLWLRNGDICQVPGTPSGQWLEEDDGIAAKFQTRGVQITIGWLVQVVYPLLTWSAKSSLALTIARLIPPSHVTHVASIIVAYLSAFAGIGIVIQTCVYCSTVDTQWLEPPYRCKVTAAAGVIRLGSEVVIDIFLILIPFCAFFWPLPSSNNPDPNNSAPRVRLRLRLPPVTRRLIKVCFTASILTTSTAIVTMILLFKTKRSESFEIRARTGFTAFVLSHLTASVSLLVCNLLIVITSLYRFLRTQMESPRVVEAGKPPVIPTLSSHQVNSGSGPIDGSGNAASGEREGERMTATGNMSGNSSGGGSSGTDGRLATRTLTSTDSSYHVEFTELFESEQSEFQRSSQYY